MCLSVQARLLRENDGKSTLCFLSILPCIYFIYFFKDLTADVLPVVALLFILKGLRPEL